MNTKITERKSKITLGARIELQKILKARKPATYRYEVKCDDGVIATVIVR